MNPRPPGLGLPVPPPAGPRAAGPGAAFPARLLVQEWLWVGLGAIPGALLRWMLHCDPLANLLGCLLIGWLAGRRPPQPRLYLLAGGGFCGALTTFGGWVVTVTAALGSLSWGSLALLLAELLVGVGAVALGQRFARPGARLGCWLEGSPPDGSRPDGARPDGARPNGPRGWGRLRR
jgi:CrcB protein